MTKAYITPDDYEVPDKTMTVHEDKPSLLVRYPKSKGGYFRVRFTPKPNPIGFHAKLPGDKRGK